MRHDLTALAHLRRARDLMDRDFDQPLDITRIARTAAMSPAHFSRQFRAAYGETPYSYLMTRRIERAKTLLAAGSLSVTDICLAVGCTSLGSFSARFTAVVGQSPTRYRQSCHRQSPGSASRMLPYCVTKQIARPRLVARGDGTPSGRNGEAPAALRA